MPWKEVTVMSEKREFIEQVQHQKLSFSELCATFNISRKTGYKWLKRFKEEGLAGLKAHSRRPHTCPLQTSFATEQLIIATREKHPSWGGEKIVHYLKNKEFKNVPCEKTADRILKRNEFISEEESQKHTPWKRFEHERPNDLWQIDFKGHFAIGGIRCFPLTLLDDHSRYSLLLKGCKNQREKTVKKQLIEVFHYYGLPKAMTMDNGTPWGYSGEQKYTRLSAWLIQLGIKVSHSRPLHPQTQGKLERFHRTLKQELLNRISFNSMADAQREFTDWQKMYNEERPHGGIENKVPASRYQKSERKYPEKIEAPEYENGFEIRKVQHGGFFFFRGKEYRIGDAFRGHAIGLQEQEDGVWKVYFYHQCVGKIDLRNH